MRPTGKLRASGLLFCAVLTACGDDTPPELSTTIAMRFERTASFWDAPFPSDDLLVDGRPRLDGFPDPANMRLVREAIGMIEDSATGFALAGGAFLVADGPLDATRLPPLADSTRPDATVQLIAVDDGRRIPVEVAFATEASAHAPPNLLSIVPLQGMPLRPHALHAAVVLRDLGDAAGRRLGRSPAIAALIAGQRPAGLSDAAFVSYRRALGAVEAAGIDGDDIAALAAFTTGDPAAELGAFRAHALSLPRPSPKRAFVAREVFEDYCVFESALDVPVYQQGEAPYSQSGGGWPAEPAVHHMEEARLFVTLPRRELPAGGLPVAVFVRTGGGGDRPLVDRGRQDARGVTLEAGEGPARQFAGAGFAGVSLDGPLGGPLRNPNGLDEQFAIFNILNGHALRDNIRQSALELILLANVLSDVRIDASSCPGGPGAAARFDVAKLAIMGHSTGAWITPLVLASEPLYRAAVLSGAGASWINNVLYKEKPLAPGPVVGGLLGVSRLSPGEPSLTLLQWAAEAADPQIYAGRIVRGVTPRHVLMMQGIVDHYILPNIANAVSLPLGVDLAGVSLDGTAGLPATQLALAPLLGFSGASSVALPVTGNPVTAVVVQHPSDGIQDGHETVYQRDEPKHQYRCFLESFARGTPRVPPPAAANSPCEP